MDNTNTSLDKILECAKASSDEISTAFLADLKIFPVANCSACQRAGRCSIEDDFDALANYPPARWGTF